VFARVKTINSGAELQSHVGHSKHQLPQQTEQSSGKKSAESVFRHCC